MNGIELSRSYYEQFGLPMLEEKFPELLEKIAVGICGPGSECFGFDDEISRDHDYEPGFIIFLPGESIVDRKTAFLLERAYDSLPADYMGVRRLRLKPVGGSRRGVKRTADFFRDRVGTPDGKMSLSEWLCIPEYARAEALNGAIFFDGYGEITAIRFALSDMPRDVWLKRMAGCLITMAQAGQYNYPRILAHGEREGAQLALFEFAQSAMELVFLLNQKPMPYYKWCFRALRSLSLLPDSADLFGSLILSGNTSSEVDRKIDTVNRICDMVSLEISVQLKTSYDVELERLAYAVNDLIEDGEIRNLSIFFTA